MNNEIYEIANIRAIWNKYKARSKAQNHKNSDIKSRSKWQFKQLISTKIQWHVNIITFHIYIWWKSLRLFAQYPRGVHTRLKTSWNILFLFMIYFICQNQRVFCHTDLSLHWHRSLFKIQSLKFRTQVKTTTLHFPCSPTHYNWNTVYSESVIAHVCELFFT